MKNLLLAYERDFLDDEFCSNIKNLENRISSKFRKLGDTGQVFSKEDMIREILDQDKSQMSIEDFQVESLNSEVFMVNYKTNEAKGLVLRTSMWTWEDKALKVFFQQGTLIGRQ